MQIKLAIILVNFRTPRVVTDCLETLLPEISDLDARVVIVDNDSGDDSVSLLSEWISAHDGQGKVVLVESGENTGFGGGNNTGIRHVDASYYLLLNSDTLVRKNAVNTLLGAAESNGDYGLFSPRLEWPDGLGQESTFRFHTPVSELLSAAQTGAIDRLCSRFVVALPVQETRMSPEWTSFACVLIRKQVFEEVGLLDDGFFMYYEDVEFCSRARARGWKILHCPESRFVHLRGGSSPVKENTRLKKRLPRYYYESRTRYFFLRYGWPGLTLANMCWWLGRCVSGLRQLGGRDDKAVVAGKGRDIWINWLTPTRPYTHPAGSGVSTNGK